MTSSKRQLPPCTGKSQNMKIDEVRNHICSLKIFGVQMSCLIIMKFCMQKLQTKIFVDLFSEIDLSSQKLRYVDSLCYNSLETPCRGQEQGFGGQDLGLGGKDLDLGDQDLGVGGQNLGLRGPDLDLGLRGQNIGLRDQDLDHFA